jgi:hypothetical protein
MLKQGHRVTLDRTLLAITAFFVIGGLIALGFLRNLSKENRALFVMASSVGILGCLAGLAFISALRGWLRKRIWLSAMVVWNESSQAGVAPKFAIAEHLVEGELRHLAIQIYSRLGYRIADRENEGGYLQLINPQGRIELIACKQQPDLIKLHHVYSLELEMKRTKAVRSFFWAPSGFTSEALDWVAHRSIVLADQLEIGRLVDCARAKGSRLLES